MYNVIIYKKEWQPIWKEKCNDNNEGIWTEKKVKKLWLLNGRATNMKWKEKTIESGNIDNEMWMAKRKYEEENYENGELRLNEGEWRAEKRNISIVMHTISMKDIDNELNGRYMYLGE